MRGGGISADPPARHVDIRRRRTLGREATRRNRRLRPGERAADRGATVETELLYGDPVERVVGYAGAGGFDGVVVGHRGLSARVEGALGSVAKELVSRSPVPVTVVR